MKSLKTESAGNILSRAFRSLSPEERDEAYELAIAELRARWRLDEEPERQRVVADAAEQIIAKLEALAGSEVHALVAAAKNSHDPEQLQHVLTKLRDAGGAFLAQVYAADGWRSRL